MKIADVIVRYVEVGDQVAMHELAVPVIVNAVSASDAAASVPDAEVTEEVVILLGARAQDEARELADAGEYDEASKKLRVIAEQLRQVAKGSARSEELETQAHAFEDRSAMLDEGAFTLENRKQMTYENRARHQRRSRPEPS